MKRIHTYRVVVVDHFDSFTYNLVVLLRRIGAEVHVIRTDASIEAIERFSPTHIVLSPGPGHPSEVWLFKEVLAHFITRVPILGVCLGFQAIAEYFGAEVVEAPTMMHGKISKVMHSGQGIFEGVNGNPLSVCRYHSLCAVQTDSSRAKLLETAWSEDGVIMAVQSTEHKSVVGVQFHPESLFTEEGSKLLQNFLSFEVRPRSSVVAKPAVEERVPCGFGQAPRSLIRGTRGWG
ncbi:MAG: aminodeoxychorismate/anthranilate synthase component II [bacterium]|nr:aminodeoxychorismate/anthranilate synthase component II [bacterium]